MTSADKIKSYLNNFSGLKSGYFNDIKDNLVETVYLSDFFGELINGNGNELDSKFKAVHSSSALAVNNFGFIKQHLNDFIFSGFKFHRASFEEKLHTGLKGTPPNLDFYLEGKEITIGFESKFLENLKRKKPFFKSNYSKEFLNNFDKLFYQIVQFYSQKEAMYLDVAQLLKHCIGLLNNSKTQQTMLCYIYWVPINQNDFKEYKQHQLELEEFEKQIQKVKSIQFQHMTYIDLWTSLEQNNIWSNHITKVKQKYYHNIT